MVRYAAAFWGLTVFMPVGVTWASAFLLLGALLLAPDRRERAARLRASPLWWPLVAYVAWTLLVLALRPHYAETPSNLVHGLRIALTIAMALALTREEALAGLRGFVAIALANIVYIGLFYLFLMRWGIWLPMPDPLRGVIMLIGNKSISNALLFTMLGAAGAAIGLAQLAARRPVRALAGLRRDAGHGGDHHDQPALAHLVAGAADGAAGDLPAPVAPPVAHAGGVAGAGRRPAGGGGMAGAVGGAEDRRSASPRSRPPTTAPCRKAAGWCATTCTPRPAA